MTTNPGVGRAWGWPIIALGAGLLTSVGGGARPMDTRALAAAGTQTALGLLALSIGIAIAAGQPVREALRVGPSRPRVTAAEWVALTLGLLALSAVLDAALEALDWRAGSRLVAIERALDDMGAGNRLIALGGIALAPAIAEEVLFRGLVLGALLRRTSVWAAIGASALLFGAAHQDLAQGLATAVLGVYLGAVSVATGSVRVSVVAHFCNNAAALLAPLAAQRLAGRPTLSLAVTIGLAAAAAGAGTTLVRRLRAGRTAPP